MSEHPNLTSLIPLFNGSDVPIHRYWGTKVGLLLAHGSNFVALPATTSDSYGYQWELNPGSLGAIPSP